MKGKGNGNFWLYLVSAILSAALSVDSAVGAGLAQKRSTRLSEEAGKLAHKIAEDQAILTKLKEAYAKRDYDLATAIVQQSPFSSSFYKLREAYNKNKNLMNKVDEDIKQSQINASKAQNEMSAKQAASQTTGSAITDLITGAAHADITAPHYESLGGKYDSK